MNRKIIVTPEMIEAGCIEMVLFSASDDCISDDCVLAVYTAMEEERMRVLPKKSKQK